MAQPRFEDLGVGDGSTTVFSASLAYTPGTTALHINGATVRAADDDGWTESNPATGEITTTEPPDVGAKIRLFYVDTIPDAADVVEAIDVALVDPEELAVALVDPEELAVALVDPCAISVALVDPEEFAVSLVDPEEFAVSLDCP